MDDLQEQRSIDLDCQDGDVAGEDRSNLDTNLEELGYGSGEDDEPDTINGLTFPEMKTILQRVSDGKVSGR